MFPPHDICKHLHFPLIERRNRIKIISSGFLYFCKTIVLVLRYGIFHQPFQNGGSKSSGIDEILESLGFDNNTINRFREEKIDRQTVKELSDLQLDNLGIKTIGDKVRLREEYRSKVAGETRQQRSLNISTGNNRISYGRSRSMGSLAQAVSERNNLFSTTARYSLPSSTSTSRRAERDHQQQQTRKSPGPGLPISFA